MAKKFTKFYNTNFYVYFEMGWNSVHALSLQEERFLTAQ